MSEKTNNTEYSGTERRSEKRLEISEKVQATTDWLISLDERVEKGLLTLEEKNKLIARSMVAREIFTERANERSRKDSMTGLLNKGAFKDDIKKLIDDEEIFSLAMVDINGFKETNDTFGHVIADKIIIQTGRNFGSVLRQIRPEEGQNDIIYRIGGDEFAIILRGISTEENLMYTCEKIRTFIANNPYPVREDESKLHIPVTISLGAGVYRGEDAENFVKRVDIQGLYGSKKAGKNISVVVPSN